MSTPHAPLDVTGFTVRFKHNLSLIQDPSNTAAEPLRLGVVASFSLSPAQLPTQLTIESTPRYEEFMKAKDLQYKTSSTGNNNGNAAYYLGFKLALAENKKLAKFYSFLQKNPNRAAYLRSVDGLHAALLFPAFQLSLGDYGPGFECRLLEKREAASVRETHTQAQAQAHSVRESQPTTEKVVKKRFRSSFKCAQVQIVPASEDKDEDEEDDNEESADKKDDLSLSIARCLLRSMRNGSLWTSDAHTDTDTHTEGESEFETAFLCAKKNTHNTSDGVSKAKNPFALTPRPHTASLSHTQPHTRSPSSSSSSAALAKPALSVLGKRAHTAADTAHTTEGSAGRSVRFAVSTDEPETDNKKKSSLVSATDAKKAFDNKALEASQHYNAVDRDRDTRHLSRIFHMRNLNNYVKSALIRDAAALSHKQRERLALAHADPHAQNVSTEGLRVLDLACGKGGDMGKWRKAVPRVSYYVGADIADVSLSKFVVERLRNLSHTERRAFSRLVHCNLATDSLSSSQLSVLHVQESAHVDRIEQLQWRREIALSTEEKFDVVSCQFAVHYFFETRDKAKHFFKEVSTHLAEGGVFIATTIDVRILALYARRALHGSVLRERETEKETDSECVPGLRGELRETRQGRVLDMIFESESGARLLTISLALSEVDRLLSRSVLDRERDSHTHKHATVENADDEGFGIEYRFVLSDSDAEAAVDAPEWVVPLGLPLRVLLSHHGLRVRSAQNLQELVCDKLSGSDASSSEAMQEMSAFRVWNCHGSLSATEWAIARLYCALVVERDSGAHTNTHTAMDTDTESDEWPALIPPQYWPSSPDYAPVCPASPALSVDAMDVEPVCEGEGSTTPDMPPPPDLPPFDLPTNTQTRSRMEEFLPALRESLSAADEEEDEDVRLFMRSSALGTLYAGGEEAFNALSEETQAELLAEAERVLRENNLL